MNFRFLCLLGIHKWDETEAPIIVACPPPNLKYLSHKRTCLWCGRQEYWLSGFSKTGCWMPYRNTY